VTVTFTLLLLLAHALSSCFMTGLIWFVQVVHYPLFSRVGVESLTEYERQHQKRTTWVVGPVMFVEGVTTALLMLPLFRPAAVGLWLPLTGGVMLLVIWCSTAFLQVPMHNRLSSGFDAKAHLTLVNTNWIRTILWSARAVLSLCMLVQGA
jgi:hypothetical protein